jgi:hypothetical protein
MVAEVTLPPAGFKGHTQKTRIERAVHSPNRNMFCRFKGHTQKTR